MSCALNLEYMQVERKKGEGKENSWRGKRDRIIEDL